MPRSVNRRQREQTTVDRGKVAFVTGAGSGIGRAIAATFIARGAVVYLSDLSLDQAQKAASETGGPSHALGLNVCDAQAVDDAVKQVYERHGRLDYMVNNAGVGLAGAVADMTVEDWRPMIDVNVWGVVHGVQAAYPRMIEQGSGHIINIASGAGILPRPGMTAYAASKHAVVGLSTSLRGEAALHNVRVSVVCPGYIKTNIFNSTKFLKIDGKRLMEKVPFRPYTAEQCAQVILAGADKNRCFIPVTGPIWVEWMLYRLAPEFLLKLSKWRARKFSEAKT